MKRPDRGYALLSVIAVVAVLLTASVATITLVRTQLRYSADQIVTQSAYYIAEAGVERAVAQLDNDAATAGTAGYVYPTIPTTTFGGGSYSVTIAQDSLFPGNFSRKRITSTGTLNGKQATIVAHALVQAPQDPCNNTVVWANQDAYVTSLATAIDQMFQGDIFANRDVHFVTALGLIPVTGANSHVYAVRNFYSDSAVVLGTPRMSAQLFYGGTYNTTADALLLIQHALGYHFSNGVNGHGQNSPAPTTRTIPAPDWQEAKSDPRTVVVNPSNYASKIAGSSWSGGAGGTLTINSFTLNADTRYYVDGSVVVPAAQLLRLLGGTSAEIWARGSITVDTFTLATIGATQNLTLVAQGDVRITGGGLVGLLNRTNILAYSYGGQAQLDNGIGAINDTRACIVGGGGNSTYRTLAAAVSGFKPIR